MTTPTKLRRKVSVDCILGPDFTVYSTDEPELENATQSSSEAALTETSESSKPQPQTETKIDVYSYDGSFAIHTLDDQGRPITETGRGLASQAFAGSYWSITLRCDAPNKRAPGSNYADTLQ